MVCCVSVIKKTLKDKSNKLTLPVLVERAVGPAKRSDCFFEIAAEVVNQYCHDDWNSHRPDSNESKPVKIGKDKWHVRRICRSPSQDLRMV